MSIINVLVQDSQGILLGVVMILSVFLLIIAIRAWKKSHVRVLGFFAGSFIAIIIGDIFLALSYVGYLSPTNGVIMAMVFLVVLLIFYAGIMRGIS
jgi:phosphatidylglycerophosphate synthase